MEHTPKPDAAPVAWMYEEPSGVISLHLGRQDDWVRWGWKETPLYAKEQPHA